jgi:predicted nicotinamide N-methyase
LAPVAGGAPLVAHQTADLFGLWTTWEAECGERCGPPFWAVVWPAANVLAGYLLAHPETVSGLRVLDLGCGGGIAGIAAAMAGARSVIANDVDAVAEHIVTLNARANAVTLTLSAEDLTTTTERAPADVVLVADMFYEQAPSRGMMAWLRASVSAGSRVLIADGGRPFSPTKGLLEVYSKRVTVSADVEGVPERLVRVLELLR